MATEKQVENLVSLIDSCVELEIDELIYDKDWGSINFEKAKPDLEKLFALCSHLKVLPLNQLPDDVAVHIHQQGEPIRKTVEEIRNFTIEQQNPSALRDNLVGQVKAHTDQLYKAAHIYVPYLAYQKGEIQRNIQDLTRSVDTAKKLLEDSKRTADEKKIEVEEIIRAARDASASVGVAHFTGDFEQEHSNLENSGKKWLAATVISATVTLGFGVYFLGAQPDLSSIAQTIQYVTTKLIILGVLLTATIWCGNIYKAIKHLSTVNKFKANSLKTFQAFVKAAGDDAVRDAVLIETTRAIFNESTTGYIDSESKSNDRNTKVVEVVKNVTQTVSAAGKPNN